MYLSFVCPAPAAYGDRAKQITRIAEEQKLGKRLVRGHPMIEAEVPYACRAEFCEHAEDFIARRTRLAFLDTAATEQALPRVGPWVLICGACFPSLSSFNAVELHSWSLCQRFMCSTL